MSPYWKRALRLQLVIIGGAFIPAIFAGPMTRGGLACLAYGYLLGAVSFYTPSEDRS